MALGWFTTRVNPIAVDVGTDSIKMLQVEPKEGQLHLVAAACAEIPEDLRNKPQARDEHAAEAIRKMLHETGFKGRQAVTCLPASQMAMQHLRIAKMTPDELTRALPFEAQGKLPFDPQRAVLRHVIAGEVYQDQEAKTEVILLAASRESVDRHLAILSKAKLDIVGIHVEPNALIECFAHLFRRKGDENISTMFVDMGAGATHVVIAHGKHMVFAKHVQIGGDALNRKVLEVLKGVPANAGLPTTARELRIRVSQQAAGALRLPAGVVALGESSANGHGLGGANGNGNGSAALDADLAARVGAALEEPIQTLIGELELCVRYYESIFPGKQIDRVIFVGGESRHVAICQKVAQRLGLPATLGDPMARLVRSGRTDTVVDMRQPQPGWAIAVGLAGGVGTE